jgi:hypothetical protein
MMSDEATITQTELVHALAALFPEWIWDGVGPAAEVFDYVARHRKPPEPDYIEGWLYQDANGEAWVRRCGEMPWRYAISGELFEHDAPTRPLRRLVPEETDKPQEPYRAEPYDHEYYTPLTTYGSDLDAHD